jgi:hypothetical protein
MAAILTLCVPVHGIIDVVSAFAATEVTRDSILRAESFDQERNWQLASLTWSIPGAKLATISGLVPDRITRLK